MSFWDTHHGQEALIADHWMREDVLAHTEFPETTYTLTRVIVKRPLQKRIPTLFKVLTIFGTVLFTLAFTLGWLTEWIGKLIFGQ